MRAAGNLTLRLPNLLIVGVAKAATTSLFQYLAQHPDIFPAELKELRYFTPLRYAESLPPIGSYLSHFQKWTTERYAVEATPGYFPGGQAVAEGINQTLPGARVILSLRDPRDRCWSYFRFMKSRVRIPQNMDFDTYLDRCEALHRQGIDGARKHQPFWGLGGGCYATWLPSWADVFGNRLHVLFFEDLIAEPEIVVADICRWLDLDSAPVASFDFATDNKSEQYHHEPLQRAALNLNRRAERFFIRHRTVKRTLKRIYDLTNADQTARKQQPSPSAWARLDDFYRPHSAELSHQLEQLGITQRPAWLAQSPL